MIKAYTALRRDVQAANGGGVPASKLNQITKTAVKGLRDEKAGRKLFASLT